MEHDLRELSIKADEFNKGLEKEKDKYGLISLDYLLGKRPDLEKQHLWFNTKLKCELEDHLINLNSRKELDIRVAAYADIIFGIMVGGYIDNAKINIKMIRGMHKGERILEIKYKFPIFNSAGLPPERLEVSWKKGIDKLVFEAEYLSEEPSPEKEVLTSYLHAEIDTELKMFNHLDGAQKSYSQEAYKDRLVSTFHKADMGKEKLFCINGLLDKDEGFKTIALFFYDPLMSNYLGYDYGCTPHPQGKIKREIEDIKTK